MIKITKKRVKYIVIFICLIGFLEIAENVWQNEIMKLDIIGYNFISKYIISDFITPIAKVITNFAGMFVLIGISVISLIIIKNKKIGLAIFGNLGLSALLNFVLKNIIQRPRPTEFRIIDEKGYSFPSGHSMVSMAFYGFIIYLIYKNIKNKYLKWISISLLSLLIFLIGISRIYLGVHYTSDVLAGFLISIAYLTIITSFIGKYINNKEMENENDKN